MPPKPDTDQQTADVTVDKNETIMTDNIPFQKLTIWSDDPDEESPEIMNALIPPLEALAETPVTDTVRSDDSTETHYEMLTEQELRLQREDEKYAIYLGILGKEEDSDTETVTDKTTYSYFDWGKWTHIRKEWKNFKNYKLYIYLECWYLQFIL